MTETRWMMVRPGWWFELLAGTVAVAALAAVALGDTTWPQLSKLLVFAAAMVLASSTQIVLPSNASVSPSFMIIMAAVAAFDGDGVVRGAMVVGLFGGLNIAHAREGKVTTMLFNAGQYSLAGGAAALVYTGTGSGLPSFVAAVGIFAVINCGLVLPQIALNFGQRPAVVWADMAPALPNYFAFGALGMLVGQLYVWLGPVSLPLLVIPAAVARMAFLAYLRLQHAHEAAVAVFVRAIEAKDAYTAGHTERVAGYSRYIAEELHLRPAQMEHLRYAALMHDIGKLAVPRRLLNKPGKLTQEEFDLVRRHNDVCVDILTRVDFLRSVVPVASDRYGHFAASAAPARAVVLEAHIVAVADAFDAMTSTRAYRQALTQEVAFAELRGNAGKQFNPDCVAALIEAIEGRGEVYGHGYEVDRVEFEVPPPFVGVGSAGLGNLLETPPAIA